MVHTLELKHILTNKDIINLESKHITIENHKTLFQETGLKMNIHYRQPYYYEEDSSGYWYAKVNMNIPEMLNKNEATDKDVKQILKTLNEFSLQFTEQPAFTLQRIDYKQDFIITDEKLRQLYINQCKKSFEKRGYLVKNTVYKTSVEFKNKNRKLIVYDKNAERKRKYKFPAKYENHVLRTEVQLKRRYIASQKRNNGFCDTIENYLYEEKKNEIFQKTVAPILFSGRYYIMDKAFEIIDRSPYRINKKTGLKELLLSVEETSLEETKQSYEVNKFRRYLNSLSDLGINPILLPDNTKDGKGTKIDELEPLFRKIS